MSRYGWPQQRIPAQRDDPAGRARFLGARRLELGMQAARARAERRRAGVAFAPGENRTDLWTPLGPSTVLGGQAAGKPRVSGRVRALFAHPEGQRLYAATANGGVWYSTDGGESWRSLGGFAPTSTPGIERPAHRHSCGAILVQPDTNDPDNEGLDRVFVGTGEITPDRGAHPGSRLGGIGILFAVGPAAATGPDPWVEEAPNLEEEGVYRLAASPDGNTIVAATSIGLVQRPPAGGQGAVWNPVAGKPFDEFSGVVTDVLWTPAVTGGPPERLWVWARGEKAGLWVRDAGETDFDRIATPGSAKLRGSLAAADPPTKVYVFNDRGEDKVAALYLVSSDGADKPTADRVDGVPDMLGHSGFYDLAIRVDPTNADRVILGGSYFEAPRVPDVPAITGQNVNVTGSPYPEDAAVFTAEVGDQDGTLTYGHTDPPLRIGVGCHADVHDLQYSDGGDVLWAACDGGVFRSIFPDQSSGFVARNNGLAVIEANYVASHPSCEGFVVVGLQDNGIIERTSSTVWLHTGDGDGGGVAFDPLRPTRYVRQYFNGQWTAPDNLRFDKLLGFRPTTSLSKTPVLHEKAEKERDDSAFYSTVATIAHTRFGAVPTHTQVLIGTTRVWYTEDWGMKFYTLPSGDDPIGTTKFDPKLDLFGEPITVCKWATSNVAWVLGDGRLERIVRELGSDFMGGPGEWDRDPLLSREAKPKKNDTSAEGPIREAVVWTDVEPNVDPARDAQRPRGAAYLGTVGRPGDTAVDTLWWFDGVDTWHPTGLRAEVSAPVTAVRCHKDHPDDVYVGTTVGIWHGIRVEAPSLHWDWRELNHGLPEAAVEDLSLFDDGNLRLLRAAIAARGVWELQLDADVVDLTYLRAHADDLRYRERAIEKQRDGRTDRSWHSSPDLRPRITPAVLPPPAAPLRKKDGVREDVRRFQAAMRSRFGDDRIRATGEWDLYFEDVLRDWGAPADPISGRMRIDAAFWSLVMIPPHDTAEPWATPGDPNRLPTEADLLELTPALPEGDANSVSMIVNNVPHKVDVVVHHRGLESRPGADVRVTLLRWIRTQTDPIPRRDDPGTWFTRVIPWAAAVNDVLNSANGTTSRTFGDGWAFVGNAATRRKTLTGQDLDNTRSAVATFDLNLTNFVGGTVMLLAAVIRAGGDSALATDTLQKLALEDAHVAVRSLVIEKP